MSSRKFYTGLFILYAAVMLWLLFDRPGYITGIPYWEQVKSSINYRPFQTLRLYLSYLGSNRPDHILEAVINLGGNVIMFIPLGFLLPRVTKKCATLSAVLRATIMLISCIELLQVILLVGVCDIDDLILNIAGAAIGFGIHKQFKP